MFPMKYLHVIESEKRGDKVVLVRRKEEDDCDLLAFAWIYREKWYFICSHYKEGVLYVDIKQLGVVVSVNIMKVWETQCFCVIQNQREYALQHTSKHA